MLTDMFGKRVTEEKFKGRYTLVGWPDLGFLHAGRRGWSGAVKDDKGKG